MSAPTPFDNVDQPEGNSNRPWVFCTVCGMSHEAGRHTGPPVVSIGNAHAKRVAGRQRLATGLYLASVVIIMLLTLTLWNAPLNLLQVVALVSCVSLLYLLGMMQGMLSALAMDE